MPDPSALFTAARIAMALGRDKRGLLRILRSIPASGKILVRGQLADAWGVERLPADYRADLERLAKLKGCRSADHLLSEGLTHWRPPIPPAELAEHHIAKAVRTKTALARSLALYAGSQGDMSEVRRIAWQDYQKEFGVVSERNVRRIFDRAIERDGGEENFDDVALYLDERLSKAKGADAILPGLLNPRERMVFQYLGDVKRPAAPTVEELDLIWHSVCQSLDEQVQAGIRVNVARKAMIRFLEKSPVALSKNSHALKTLLKRKYGRYLACGGVFNLMCDKRAEKSGWKRAVPLLAEDKKLIVAHAALQKGGRLAPAWRDLRDSGRLSSELLEHHNLENPASKSYVPASIRAQVQPDVRRLKNSVHGSRTHRLLGAHLTRDYSAMAAGDFFEADDVTLPVYYYEETEGGPARMRGQFLVMIDVRTDFVLGFLLISARNYDSLTIRSLVTICAAKHGLPRRGFKFERGIWKSSKIIAGSRNAVPFEHADRGLRSLGMELHHALLPRGKVIERTIGQLQNRMEGFPGYVGRDERRDVRERVQRDFLDVDAGRRPINECLLSKAQYCEALAKIIEDHNAEPQEGRLNGMSPAEAWERLQGDKPRQGFSNRWRYVLARDVRKLKVGRNGITLRYGKKTFIYHDAETGKRVGEEVLAWFDPMLPDVLACTDLNHQNVFSVERANDVPAMDASPELLAAETAKIAAHNAYAKSLYWTSQNTLKSHHYAMTIADAGTLKIGADIAAQSERITARNEERKQRTRVNRAVIENKRLPEALLQSASDMPTKTVAAIAELFSENETEEKS